VLGLSLDLLKLYIIAEKRAKEAARLLKEVSLTFPLAVDRGIIARKDGLEGRSEAVIAQ